MSSFLVANFWRNSRGLRDRQAEGGAPPPDPRTVLRGRPTFRWLRPSDVACSAEVREEIGEDSLGHAPDDRVFQLIRVDWAVDALKCQMNCAIGVWVQ